MTKPADKWMQKAREIMPKHDWDEPLSHHFARALEATDKAATEQMYDWLNSMPKGWELSCENEDKDDISSDLVWVVYAVHGGRNDKEWDKLGRGDTPSNAISAAFLAAAIRKGTE